MDRRILQLPVIRALPLAKQAQISEASELIDLRAGEYLWTRGEAAAGFCFLVFGQVRLIADTRSVRNLIIDIVATPDALVCTPAVCTQSCYCCHAQSTQKTRLLFVPSAIVFEDSISPLATLLLKHSSLRAMNLCRRLREVSGNKVQYRVAEVLWRLADERGTSDGQHSRLPSISRSDLAGLSGCATETLIRVLAELEAEGLVTREGRALLVDLPALADFIRDEHARDH